MWKRDQKRESIFSTQSVGARRLNVKPWEQVCNQKSNYHMAQALIEPSLAKKKLL